MEIQRLGSFPDLPLDSAPAAEGETAVKGARRAEAESKQEGPAPGVGDESLDPPVESRPAESRQGAEALKARLFARCDRETAGASALSPPADAESSLIADVTDYLRRHPGAEDSLEGIDAWREFEGMAGLDARGEAIAIDRLVIRGEGWTRDEGATEASGSSEEAAGDHDADDPDRG